MTFSEAKTTARNNLKDRWGAAIVFMLLYALVAGLLSSTVIGILLFSSMLMIGAYSFYINLAEPRFERIIDGLRENLTERIILSVMKNIFIFLWSLLFVIPGIVKSYSYALAELISISDPTKDHNACLKESSSAMDGRKMDLFLFDLSFIGWFILCGLTFGILLLYVGPYYYASRTEYMRSIARERGYNI